MSQTTQKVFTPLLDKTVDESRQGTPFALDKPTHPRGLAYIETYGCQMNFSDTEIIASTLQEMGYGFTREEETANLVLLNTCAIRENAEQKVWHRLNQLRGLKRRNPELVVGLMGCMAERLKKKVLEDAPVVDIVVGPDAYRDLPNLLATAEGGQKAVNVLLSREETYADLAPIRLNTNGVSAFVSIMRGCDNMCSFCVVPFTRGRERSRDPQSILHECQDLVDQGYKEVTLLGQNVDSYHVNGCDFADLLAQVAQLSPLLRVRFSTSHPKDLTERVAQAIAAYPNICNYIHLPVQSGSSRILEKMNRGYTREWYLERIDMIRRHVPDIAFSTDIITGFCSETEDDHQATLSLMQEVAFDHAFMFAYSERPGTPAAKRFADDVPAEVKQRRLAEVIELQGRLSAESNLRDVGKTFTVLIEGNSKRSADDFASRNDQNKLILFPKAGTNYQPGDYVEVAVTEATRATLIGHLA